MDTGDAADPPHHFIFLCDPRHDSSGSGDRSHDALSVFQVSCFAADHSGQKRRSLEYRDSVMVDHVLELSKDSKRTHLGLTPIVWLRTMSTVVVAGFLVVGVWSGIDARQVGADTPADPMAIPPTVEEAALQDEGLQAFAWENLMTSLSLEANELGRAKWDSINAARRAASFDANH